MVNNYERDGHMRVDGNSDGTPDYFLDSFDNIKPDENYE
jgi:catalase